MDISRTLPSRLNKRSGGERKDDHVNKYLKLRSTGRIVDSKVGAAAFGGGELSSAATAIPGVKEQSIEEDETSRSAKVCTTSAGRDNNG